MTLKGAEFTLFTTELDIIIKNYAVWQDNKKNNKKNVLPYKGVLPSPIGKKYILTSKGVK